MAAILSRSGRPGSADRPRMLARSRLRVAQTLAYAHAKGVIHRDLKPANIMVGAFGEVQVMDWGLAKVLAEGGIADEERANRAHQEAADVTTIRTARSAGGSGTDTEAGSILGTPAYMPPEQASGDILTLDRRADVFALGAILSARSLPANRPISAGPARKSVARRPTATRLTPRRGWKPAGADAELIGLTPVVPRTRSHRPAPRRAGGGRLADCTYGRRAGAIADGRT